MPADSVRQLHALAFRRNVLKARTGVSWRIRLSVSNIATGHDESDQVEWKTAVKLSVLYVVDDVILIFANTFFKSIVLRCFQQTNFLCS